MQFGWLVDFRTLVLNNKILCQGFKELLGSHSVQVLYDSVVVKNCQLRCGETYCHKVVVLLITTVVRILFCLFCTHQRSCSTTVMTISDIQSRHFCKLLRHSINVLFITDNPQFMTESVYRSNKVISRFSRHISCNKFIQNIIIRISEEDRFDVCIANSHMLHSILFLVSSCKLMLFDYTIKVVLNKRTDNQAVLSLAIHRLRINVIAVLSILSQPTLLLEHLEVFCCLVIHSRIILTCTFLKINFRLYYVVQTHFISCSLSSCFFAVKHIVWT